MNRIADQQLVFGIDISKDHLDVVAGSQGKVKRYDHNRAGIGRLRGWVKSFKRKVLVVVEATGGMERDVVRAFQDAGIDVAVLNPRQVRDFAKATGRLEKTDKIDASIIALFGERLDVKLAVKPNEDEENLQALVRRRENYVEMITAEKNRKGSAWNEQIVDDIEHHLRYLEERKKEVENEIEALSEANPEISRKRELYESMIGIAGVTSAVLAAMLPELGKLNRKEIAKLVGLAPLANTSGKFKGKSKIRGGRKCVRNALYMPAMSAKQHNPKLKALNERLIAKGKEKKLATTAVMRKMLTILNAMARDGKQFSLAAT